MTLLPARTELQARADNERITLDAYLRTIASGESLYKGHQRSVPHFVNLFANAKDPTGVTRTHDRFVEVFGEETGAITTLLHTYFNGYWQKCRTAGKLLAFGFNSEDEKEAIVQALTRMRAALKFCDDPFTVWPPPRPPHSCF